MSHPLPPLRPYVNGVQSEDVRLPRVGELILIRLPFDMPGPTSIISSSAISGSNSRNYHPCVVVGIILGADDWEIEVFICRSYTNVSDPVSYVSSLPPADRSLLLPLPSNPRPDTPAGFGAPLSFGNSYFSQKPGWLVAKLLNVNMGGNSMYKPFHPRAMLPASEISRIRAWLVAVPGTSSTLLLPGMEGAGASAARDAGPGAAGGAAGGASGPTGGNDNGAKGSAYGPGPIHNTTQLRVAHRQKGAFVIESPQDNDSDNDDAYDDIFSNEAFIPFKAFQLADPNSNYWAAQVARQEAEHRNVVQQWIMSL